MSDIKAIVVDDEYLNRELISKLIISLDVNFKIVGTAENIDMAFELINKFNPDVVFLDVKMPDGNGFDLLKRFDVFNFEVVFVTGFDEYAIQAFDFNALDYILKPIDIDKLKITLHRIVQRLSNKSKFNFSDIIDSYNVDYSKINKIPIHHNDKVVLLDIANIVYISTYNGYTKFKMVNFEEYLSSKQFNAYEFIMNHCQFLCKISKSICINVNHIKSYTKGSVCQVTLSDNSVFDVSRRKKTEILTFFDLKKNY